MHRGTAQVQSHPSSNYSARTMCLYNWGFCNVLERWQRHPRYKFGCLNTDRRSAGKAQRPNKSEVNWVFGPEAGPLPRTPGIKQTGLSLAAAPAPPGSHRHLTASERCRTVGNIGQHRAWPALAEGGRSIDGGSGGMRAGNLR